MDDEIRSLMASGEGFGTPKGYWRVDILAELAAIKRGREWVASLPWLPGIEETGRTEQEALEHFRSAFRRPLPDRIDELIAYVEAHGTLVADMDSVMKVAREDGRQAAAGDGIEELDAEDFARAIQEDVPLLVDFWAAWCGPCRAVAPIVRELAADLSGQLRVAKLDVEAYPEVSERLGIKRIPVLVLFSAGKELTRIAGAQSKERIRMAVTPFLP